MLLGLYIHYSCYLVIDLLAWRWSPATARSPVIQIVVASTYSCPHSGSAGNRGICDAVAGDALGDTADRPRLGAGRGRCKPVPATDRLAAATAPMISAQFKRETGPHQRATRQQHDGDLPSSWLFCKLIRQRRPPKASGRRASPDLAARRAGGIARQTASISATGCPGRRAAFVQHDASALLATAL